MTNHLPYWLAAMHLPSIGPRSVLRWLEHFKTIADVFQATPAMLIEAGMPPAQQEAILAPDWHAVEEAIAWSQLPDHHLLTLTDPAYPAALKEISDPPLVLFIHGSLSALSQPQIAIVGSRHASSAGLQDASDFAYCLASAGYAITSGLALGIDGASHQGALAAKGVTIGVLGTGQQRLYPRTHQSLAAAIAAAGGAIVSEFPLKAGPHAQNFPRRNRVISGLSIGVLVVEAALKSGSLITAKYALEQGRDVFAIPGSIHHALSHGCHHLIRQGAKLVEKAQDILEELPQLSGAEPAQVPHAAAAPLPANCARLLKQIDYASTTMDMILLRSRLTVGEVSSMLLILELHGYIESVTGGYRRTAAKLAKADPCLKY